MTGACGLKLRVMWEVKMFMAYMSMEAQVVGEGGSLDETVVMVVT